MIPSLSILLPCRNEERSLPRQLKAIMPQLAPQDEIVFLDDASEDGTSAVMEHYAKLDNVQFHVSETPKGVNAAFNYCAANAKKDWVLGCSGNDEVQPGAFAAWRKVAALAPTEWPDVRVIMGKEAKGGHEDKAVTYYTPDTIMPKWKEWGGHRIDGCSTFIRRDSWGRGYSAGQWMADWWHIFQLICRHGIVHIPAVISRMGPAGFSADHNDDGKYNNKAMREIRIEAYGKECKDIRKHIDFSQKLNGFLSYRQPMIWFERPKSGKKGK